MIATFLAALQLAATVPAIEIESTSKSESEMMPTVQASRSITTMSGRNVRLEQVEGDRPGIPGSGPGTYMLMLGDNRKLYSVDPAKKEYYEFDIAKMQSQIGAMMKAMPGMQMKFSDLEYKVEDLGDGEPILGHPTRRFKISNEMTMNAAVGGDSMAITMSTTSDTYYAKDLEIDGPEMMSIGDTTVLSQFGDMIPAAYSKRVREESKKLPKLVSLKSVANVVSSFGPMDMTMTMTNLVSRVTKKQVPAATFEVPAGYKKIDMPELTGVPARQ